MTMDRTTDIVRKINDLTGGAHLAADPTVSDDAMRSAPDPIPAGDSLTALYGEVIDVYTRAEAIADGALVEVPQNLVRDAGIGVPVALTRAAHTDCVAWTDADYERTGAYQDETGRFWDVLWMGWNAAKRARPEGPTPIPFTIYRIARDATPDLEGDVEPTPVRLQIVLGADYDGSPAITIMLPGED